MKNLLLLLFGLLSICAYAQDIKPAEKLILSDSLVFLGIDFSQAKMINPADVDKGELIRDKHGPYWSLIDDDICQSGYLKYNFLRKNVVCILSYLDSSYTKLFYDWVVPQYADITDSQIVSHVKTYPIIPGYKVGIAFIVDKMDKKKTSLTMYGVYINLADNSVLKIIKSYGAPDGFGYSRYWTTGITTAYSYFTTEDQNYLHRLKRHFKKKANQ